MGVGSVVRGCLFVAWVGAVALPLACNADDRVTQPLGPDIGAGHVDSPPLPPLLDDPAAYDPTDDEPVNVSVTVQDARAFAAIEAGASDAGAPILFAASDYGDGRTPTSAAATIELRGSTSRTAVQKSYQIKLAADAPRWRGART